jgi:hypothetical protein
MTCNESGDISKIDMVKMSLFELRKELAEIEETLEGLHNQRQELTETNQTDRLTAVEGMIEYFEEKALRFRAEIDAAEQQEE